MSSALAAHVYTHHPVVKDDAGAELLPESRVRHTDDLKQIVSGSIW
jgi:hypothetical protein